MNIIQHFKPVQSKLATVSGTLDLRGKINTLRKSSPDRAYLFPLLGSVPCVSDSSAKVKCPHVICSSVWVSTGRFTVSVLPPHRSSEHSEWLNLLSSLVSGFMTCYGCMWYIHNYANVPATTCHLLTTSCRSIFPYCDYHLIPCTCICTSQEVRAQSKLYRCKCFGRATAHHMQS